MKKVFGVILSFVCVFILGACGSDKKNDEESKYIVNPNQWVEPWQVIEEEVQNNIEATYATISVKYTTGEGDTVNGEIVIRLFESVAPKTVANFKKLVNDGFYDGLNFHRVINDFMIQGGNPEEVEDHEEADKIKGEFANNDFFNPLKHMVGVVSMARVSGDNDSASSQFFICENREGCTSLDGDYAAFGVVIEGMDYVHEIAELEVDNLDEPIDNVEIVTIKMGKLA